MTERAAWSFRRPVGIILVALWAILILGLVFFPYGRAEAHFAHASRPYEVDDQGQVLARVVKRIEGTSDTWQLLRRDLFGEPYYYRLLSDAFSMSATNPRNQRYMRLFAYLPSGVPSRSKRCAASLLWMRRHGGCASLASQMWSGSMWWTSQKKCSLWPIFIPESITPTRCVIRACTLSFRMADFFCKPARGSTTSFRENRLRRKMAGAVNLYTQEFFSLMRSRLKENGIATFWLPINQLKVEETKAILRAFHNAFPNALVWGGADQDWIMMGINGPGRRASEDEFRQLWNDPATGADLRTIGIEVPQQLGALFLMDGDEIDRITHDVAPLTDIYPKRLTDRAVG